MKRSDLFTSSVKLLMGEVDRSAFGRSEGLDTDGRICAPFWGCVQWKHTSTHIATTGYMFYIIFGATPGLHTAQVQLLIENLHLESWYMGVKKNTVMAAKAKSCEWRRLLERKIRCWRDEFEARGSESWPKPSWGDVPTSPHWCFEAITIRWSISEVFKLYRGNHQVRPLRAKSSSEMTPTLTCSKTGFDFIFTKLKKMKQSEKSWR